VRILFITNYYPPYEVGGYEQLCRDVAEHLARRGHVIQILTSDRGVAKHGPVNEVNVYRVLRLQLDYESGVSPAFQFLSHRRTEVYNLRCLRARIAEFAPDVIFIWNLQGLPYSLASEAELISGGHVAYWLAGYSPAEPDAFWVYWERLNGRSWRRPLKALVRPLALGILRAEGKPVRPRMDHVAVVSEYIRRQGIAQGTLPAHARVIYNGVEVDRFYQPVQAHITGPLTVLQAGRVSADKGVHTAVEAIGRLVHEQGIRDVHLQIAGTGPAAYTASLQQLAKEYGIEDKVSFLGWVPRERMPELMARCHVLLLPTINQEPFARVALEAMASGLVVIGTLTGGTGELLQHGVTGLAFSPGDSHDLTRQIRRLLQEPDLRRQLATKGQQMVLERFSLERMVSEVERLLGEACTT